MKRADYSKITDYLFVGRTPSKRIKTDLLRKNVKLIINMRAERDIHKTFKDGSFELARLKTLDSRFFPITHENLLRGAMIGLLTIQRGGAVYIYCQRGRHRSAALAAVILIAKGYSQKEALDLLIRKRPSIDPYKPHILKAIENFANRWHKEV